MSKDRRTSHGGPLDDEDKAIVLMLKAAGFPIHRIGALFDVNQGRISEVVTHAGLDLQRANHGPST